MSLYKRISNQCYLIYIILSPQSASSRVILTITARVMRTATKAYSVMLPTLQGQDLLTFIMTSWHGNTFPVLLALCEGNPPVTGGFPSQMASNSERWYFLCCEPTDAVELTVE